MSKSIITTDQQRAIEQRREVSEAFDKAAALAAFSDYRSRKSANTIKAQDSDLGVFTEYLDYAGAGNVGDLANDPLAWANISHGLVAGFVQWQLKHGYAIGTVNRRLSTVKKYAKMAAKAGAIDATQKALISDVTGYGNAEGKRLNERRAENGVNTRRVIETDQGAKVCKKAEHVTISDTVAKALKTQHPDTPQGRRDAVLMCLLLDHGLRCGEVVLLQVSDFDLKANEFKFYRPKVDKVQTHRLTPDTRRALLAWFDSGDAPAAGPLLRSSRKNGNLTHAGMKHNAISRRVRDLGLQHGISGLSAHDCRHYWATRASRKGTDPFALQEAGGWNSLAMPRRYVEAAKIANEGVRLD